MRAHHPVDVVESLAHANDWHFDRDGDDEISLTIGGGWCDYQVAFTWLEDVEALHISCAFDIKKHERRNNEIFQLIAAINEQMWVGHFGFWKDEGMVIFRHALVLAGGLAPSAQQCETVLSVAIASCERYYQAFQFVLWAGKTAKEALESAMIETEGEA
ncbi:MAG: YbjN domain-containing protein [Beijerinckiaceae bacterium]